MPPTETRPLGAAELGKLSFPGGNDNRVYPTKSALNQVQLRARLRRQRQIEHLHRLGPAPLGHFIREVEVATRADVTARLERYAQIDSEFVRALGGDRFAPSLHCIDGGRRP